MTRIATSEVDRLAQIDTQKSISELETLLYANLVTARDLMGQALPEGQRLASERLRAKGLCDPRMEADG